MKRYVLSFAMLLSSSVGFADTFVPVHSQNSLAEAAEECTFRRSDMYGYAPGKVVGEYLRFYDNGDRDLYMHVCLRPSPEALDPIRDDEVLVPAFSPNSVSEAVRECEARSSKMYDLPPGRVVGKSLKFPRISVFAVVCARPSRR